jgi:hypothetical protein
MTRFALDGSDGVHVRRDRAVRRRGQNVLQLRDTLFIMPRESKVNDNNRKLIYFRFLSTLGVNT